MEILTFKKINSLPQEIQNTLIITATPYQAEYLQYYYTREYLDRGLQHWPMHEIYQVNTWLRLQWQVLHEQNVSIFPYLLTEIQAWLLWRRVLTGNAEPIVYQLESLADAAKEARELLALYGGNLNQYVLSENTEAWLAWLALYEAELTRHRCCDLVGFIKLYTEYLTHKPAPTSTIKTVVLYGFSACPPLIVNLFKILNSQIEVLFFEENKTNAPDIGKFIFNDPETEIYAMVHWMDECAHKNKRIACVVPHLPEYTQRILNAAAEIFPKNKFQISVYENKSLFSLPLISHALLFLNLLKKEMAFEDWRIVLHSVFMGGYAEEFLLRGNLVTALAKLGEAKLSAREVWAQSLHCPDLMLRLQSLPQVQYAKQSVSAWAQVFNQAWEILGWPGSRVLSALEQKAWEASQQILLEFAAQQLIYPVLTLSEALALLRNLVLSWNFVPEKSPHAQIHLLPLGAITGLKFDAVWVMGLSDYHMPSAPRIQPFLPIALQTEHHYPHASSDWEYSAAEKLMRAIVESAPVVRLSYAQEVQGETITPSPFLAEIPVLENSNIKTETLNTRIFSSQHLEYFQDEQGPALQDLESTVGGSNILKDQALCPFRAYAKHRLHAQIPEKMTLGLSMREKGIALHHALELIWRELKTQAQLLAYTEEDLQSLIVNAIKKALLPLIKSRPRLQRSKIIALEQTRLRHILTRWLALEKNRDPFTVCATEQVIEGEFAGIKLTLRVDRIDQTDNLNFYIIDYKMGQLSPALWFDERLEEPQLPLYGLMSDFPISGLLFAQLRADNMGFKGIVAETTNIPGVVPLAKYKTHDWPTQLEAWRGTLTQLAVAYTQGIATVQPKTAQTCLKCDLQTLCRIYA